MFAGTVNHSTYLRDETGGRRFWPIACGRIDVESLAHDRNQLWAEAKVRFDAGSVWWLDSAALVQMASDEQAERYEGDPGEEVIGRWVDNRSNLSISEVLERCLQKPQGLWTQSDKNRAARCLRFLGWERYRTRGAFGMEISQEGGMSSVPSLFPVPDQWIDRVPCVPCFPCSRYEHSFRIPFLYAGTLVGTG